MSVEYLQRPTSYGISSKQALTINIHSSSSSSSSDHHLLQQHDQFIINDFAESIINCSSPDSTSSCHTSLCGDSDDMHLDSCNPYRQLIEQSQSPQQMTEAYEKHRRTRNAAKFTELATSHKVSPDPILSGLVLDNKPPEFDPRNCITIWGRPPAHVMDLIANVQSRLVQSLNPHLAHKQACHIPRDWTDKTNKGPLWLMPRECLHLSVLEIIHSAPVESVLTNLDLLRPYINELLNPIDNAPVLMRPLVCFDSSALALTFVPIDHAIQKLPHSKFGIDATEKEARYSYTHYRASLYETVTNVAGVNVESRYQVPSAHVTIARFIKELSPDAIDSLLSEIEKLNQWLDAEYSDPSKFAWRLGQERATECRYVRIWYGGGASEGQGLTLDSFDF